MHEANLTSEAPVADAEASQSGQLAAQLRQSVLHGLNCGSGVEYGCVETKATMLLELICVMITFALSCWGGWLFSQYYFTRATSQVRYLCCIRRAHHAACGSVGAAATLAVPPGLRLTHPASTSQAQHRPCAAQQPADNCVGLCALLTFACFRTSLRDTQAVRLERSVARRFFCVVFGACCNAIVIILFELLDVLSFDFRLAALKAHIATLVLFMLCAIPWCAPALLAPAPFRGLSS